MALGAFRYVIHGHDPRRVAAVVDEAAQAAVARVLRQRVNALKNDLRRLILAAGLGQKLANTVRGILFKDRNGFLQGAVFSKALYRRRGGLVDLLTVFQQTTTITGLGKFLVIPLSDRKAGRDNRARATPADFPAGSLERVPTRRAGVYLLVEKGGSAIGTARFLLVKRVILQKRLDFVDAFTKRSASFDVDVAKEWDREIERRALAA